MCRDSDDAWAAVVILAAASANVALNDIDSNDNRDNDENNNNDDEADPSKQALAPSKLQPLYIPLLTSRDGRLFGCFCVLISTQRFVIIKGV